MRTRFDHTPHYINPGTHRLAWAAGQLGWLSVVVWWAAILVAFELPTWAATFKVTNTNDSGAGSLRQAILNANANPGTDTINFSIASGVQTIAPLSALPIITGPVIIDGSTQAGYSGVPLVELSGVNRPDGGDIGLYLQSGNSTVRGLMINDWGNGGVGIILETNGNNVVQGNYIGLDATGTEARGNEEGIVIFTPGNLIGGTTAAARNVIVSCGNNAVGIRIATSSATGNIVQGNLVGTNASGTAVPQDPSINSLALVWISCADNNTIGGTTPEAGNVISGSNKIGLLLLGQGNLVQGNLIGTQIDGISPLGNREAGVYIQTGPDCGTRVTKDNTIGGETNDAANIIAYTSQGPGVAICPYKAACLQTVPVGNKILGNSIFSNAGLGCSAPHLSSGWQLSPVTGGVFPFELPGRLVAQG